MMDCEKRLLDPEQVHQIWFGIINEWFKVGANPTLHAVFSLLNTDVSSKQSNSEPLSKRTVNQAIKEGLIGLLNLTDHQPVTNGLDSANLEQISVTLPQDPVQRSDHDWYCSECHQVGAEKLLECGQCWRSFHIPCAEKLATSIAGLVEDLDISSWVDSTNFLCPVCNFSQIYSQNSIGSRQFSQQEFNEILSYTYSRFKLKCSILNSLSKLTPLGQQALSPTLKQLISLFNSSNGCDNLDINSKDVASQLSYHYLTYKSIHLEDIEQKLTNSCYTTISDFFGDCHSLLHMFEVVIIANGEQTTINRRRLRDASARLFEVVRYDLKEMIGCVDCYRNSNRQNVDKYWFCRPCEPPHLLVFAKQKGFSFWPAKVIYPRCVVDIDSCSQYDVRFFGSNHERSLIDRANIKDINSSLAELNITKPISSLEKALAELRNHRDLLENGTLDLDETKETTSIPSKRTNARSVSSASEQSSTTKRRVSCDTKSEIRNSIESGEPTSDTEQGNSDTELENETDGCSKIRRSKRRRISLIQNNHGRLSRILREDLVESENEVTNETAEEEEDVEQTDVEEKNETEEEEEDNQAPEEGAWRRKRGRPPKSRSAVGIASAAKSPSKARIRRKKILYSPQASHAQSSSKTRLVSPPSPAKVVPLAKRGRKPKSMALLSVPTPEPKTPSRRPTGRNSDSKSSPASKNGSPLKSSTPKISPRGNRSHRKKTNAERQRQVLQALKKLKKEHAMHEAPKHIPPVTATKSLPKYDLSTKSINSSLLAALNKLSEANLQRQILKPILNSTYSGLNPPQVNGFQPVYPQMQYTNASDYSYVKIENENTEVVQKPEAARNLELEVAPPAEEINFETFKPPSSVLRPLINGEVKEDDDEMKITNELMMIESNSANQSINGDVRDNSIEIENADSNATTSTSGGCGNKSTVNNHIDDDDDEDDEEPYQYDDEQLQKEISDYLEYEQEQENLIKQQQLQQKLLLHQLQQQQQLLQQQQQQPKQTLSNGFSHPEPKPKVNGYIESAPIKNYIEFSSNSVYSPTRKNQKLLNMYLHHANNNTLPNQRNDFLAQYILHKDEFEADTTERPPSPKRRGRPPKGFEKTGDSLQERSGKAKCLLEKTYLQESSCNRTCLTNNMKAFKRFRDYVEAQHRNEIAKLKKEIEGLKQQVYRLDNLSKEMTEKLKLERDLVKEYDPHRIRELEEKHRKEISEIKRKQWCTVCECEAQFICCYNTNYCSPQCQHKHWSEGHQNSCGRVRMKMNSLNRKATKLIKQCKSGVQK